MRILLIFFLLVSTQNLFSQKNSVYTSPKIPFDTNKIKDTGILSNSSEVFRYDSLYIWNDKRTLSEIMNERSGFFTNDFNLGGRNLINYNGNSSKDIGIYRDGMQINDILFGGFDIQNITINEIEKIEEISAVSSFLYGNNSGGKSINVITKDVFRTKPFSQLRYSQDRFNSLYADAVFNLPFTKKINWMAGATKHSIDGRYENSEFDVWNAKTRLSFYTSPKFNIKLNFYYDNIKRGLNEGLVYSPNESVLENSNAKVLNPVSDEKINNFYYNADLTGRFFKNKYSLTKLILYSINSDREYNNIDTISYDSLNVFTPSADYHYVQYAADLKQNLNFRITKKSFLDLLFGFNVYYNLYNYSSQIFYLKPASVYSFLLKSDYSYGNLFLSAFFKYDNIKMDETSSTISLDKLKSDNDFNIGTEGSYKFIFNRDFQLKLYGGINNTNNQYKNVILNASSDSTGANYYKSNTYYEFGFDFNFFKYFELKTNYFKNNFLNNTGYYDNSPKGINSTFSFKSKYADAVVSYNYLKSDYFPENFIKSDIAFHDFLFRNKLNLRTGFNIKYYTSPDRFYAYSQSYYSFYSDISKYINLNGFQVDYYLGARIGHANINITVANIFNTFYYDTYIYPADNLGGFLNCISRFTIVWDFLN